MYNIKKPNVKRRDGKMKGNRSGFAKRDKIGFAAAIEERNEQKDKIFAQKVAIIEAHKREIAIKQAKIKRNVDLVTWFLILLAVLYALSSLKNFLTN